MPSITEQFGTTTPVAPTVCDYSKPSLIEPLFR